MGKHKYTLEELKEWYREHGVGFIYYNPDDRNIWVPKASGLGFTLNFAHPLSFAIMALVLGVIVGLTICGRTIF